MKKLITRFLGVVFIGSTIISFSSGNNKKSFLDPPEIIKKEQIEKQHSSESRKFSGISSLAVSPGGRMWAVWYAVITPGEDLNNYVVVATSGDKGKIGRAHV